MNGAYAVRFTVGDTLWMTTVDDQPPERRARRRARLRAYGRRVWRRARREGARPCSRYVMLATIGGRRESPILAAETLKPLIDAGTDERLWPDDDPYHRIMTCYLPDPRPLPRGRAELNIWILPVPPALDPTMLLLDCMPGAQATLASMEFPDRLWLTSNMRHPAGTRLRMQGMAVNACRGVWHASPGPHCAVVCQVAYPDGRREYQGDPDNTAETATGMWGCGVMEGLLPATPGLFAFTLAPYRSAPRTHGMRMLAFPTPADTDWPTLLLDHTRTACA